MALMDRTVKIVYTESKAILAGFKQILFIFHAIIINYTLVMLA